VTDRFVLMTTDLPYAFVFLEITIIPKRPTSYRLVFLGATSGIGMRLFFVACPPRRRTNDSGMHEVHNDDAPHWADSEMALKSCAASLRSLSLAPDDTT